MTILKMVNVFKKKIQEYIKNNPDAGHDEILRALLRDFSTQSSDTSQNPATSNTGLFSQQSNNMQLVKALMGSPPDDDNNTIDMINIELQTKPLNKNDSFFALLVAYYYYFENLYTSNELQAREAFYRQVIIPLHLYRDRIENDRSDFLIEKIKQHELYFNRVPLPELKMATMPKVKLATLITLLLEEINHANKSIRNNAFSALMKIYIPEDQQDLRNKVVTALLNSANDTRPDILKNACSALGKISIPLNRFEAVINTLLQKIENDDDEKIRLTAYQTLSEIAIPEYLLERVVPALLIKTNHPVKDIACDACVSLGKIPIPASQLTAVIDAISKMANDSYTSVEAYTALGKLAIPDDLQTEIINECLKKITSNDDSCLRGLLILERIPLLKKQIQKITTELLRLLDNSTHQDAEVTRRACLILGHITPIPEDQITNVIRTLLNNANHDNMRIRFGACNALGNIAIPTDKRESVITALLTKMDDSKNLIQREACAAFGKMTIPKNQQATVINALLAKTTHQSKEIYAEAFKTLGKIRIPHELRELVIAKLLDYSSHHSEASEAFLAVYKKMLPTERMAMVANLESKENPQLDPYSRITLQVLTQACQQINVSYSCLKQHLPPEKIEEVEQWVDKKHR